MNWGKLRDRRSTAVRASGGLLFHANWRAAQAAASPAGTATSTESAPATCTCRRTSYCDMYPRQDPLLRYVTRQPIPPQRHVPPAGPATATCDPSADPAPATCASRRTGYCDMWLASRPCSSDMYLPRDRLLRHVTGQPTPLQRHVLPAGPATATCTGQPTPLQRHVPPGGPATATCDGPADPSPATCTSRRTRYCDM